MGLPKIFLVITNVWPAVEQEDVFYNFLKFKVGIASAEEF